MKNQVYFQLSCFFHNENNIDGVRSQKTYFAIKEINYSPRNYPLLQQGVRKNF